MLIGVDVSPAAKEKKTGIEWYCFHVANELAKMDTTNQYRFYTKEPVAHKFTQFPSNFTEVVLPHKSFWTHTALAQELAKNPVDVFYSPSHIIPWKHPKHTITTIHDAGFRHYRKNYSFYQFLHATVNLYLSARWASNIIVPAQFVANDIATIYNLKGKKVSVIPNGFDAEEFKGLTPAEIEEAKSANGVTGKYFIFVGRMEVRKNLLRTLAAFFDLVNTRKEQLQFVIVGSPAVGFEEIDAYIKSQPNAHLVVRPGYVSSRHKAGLLAGSEGLVFPSLYEGFGIPILEGFAAGTPVITSNLTACPEVAGDAAIIVDAHDTAAIRKAMGSLLDDPSLRRDLIAKGFDRIKQFGWDITARTAHALLIEKGVGREKSSR